MKNLDTKYDPKKVEDRLYSEWVSKGYFQAKPNPDKKPGESDEPSKNENNNNKVINGETDYKERIDEYIKTYEELKAQGAEIPEELQKIIDDYYNSLD